MNRANAVAHAMECIGTQRFTELLSRAYSIPSEPVYVWRCTNCCKEREPMQPCCGEVQNEEMAECPVCEDNVEWKTGTTGCGIEAHTPYCVNPKCKWEGDPQ